MANRRKFLAGLGALASGSAAAVGTGAFTTVTAQRSVSVNVSGDNSAYLGLAGAGSGDTNAPSSTNSDYVTQNGSSGELEIDLAGGGSTSGSGVNPDALTNILGLFTIRNQGTQSVDVYVTKNDNTGTDYSDRVGVFAVSGTSASSGDIASGNEISGSTNSISLDTGNSLVVSLQIDTQSEGASSSATKAAAGSGFTNTSAITSNSADLLDSLTINAEDTS